MSIRVFFTLFLLTCMNLLNAQQNVQSSDQIVADSHDKQVLIDKYQDSVQKTKNDLQYHQKQLNGLIEMNDIAIGPLKYEIPKLKENLESLKRSKEQGDIGIRKYEKKMVKINKVLEEYETILDKTNQILIPKKEKINALQEKLKFYEEKIKELKQV